MPRKQKSELTTGLMVLAGLAALVGVVFWLGAVDILNPPQQEAWFYLPQSEGPLGLMKGSQVKIGDELIGQVDRIVLDNDNGRVLYVVAVQREGLKVHADGKARVAANLVGTAALAVLSTGSADAPLADRDNAILLSSGAIDQAMNHLAEAAKGLSNVVASLEREMDPARREALLAKVHLVVDDLQKAAGEVSAMAGSLNSRQKGILDAIKTVADSLAVETDATLAGSLLAKVHGVADNATEASADVAAITADARPKMERTMTAVADTAARVNEYAKDDLAALLSDLRTTNSEVLKIARDFAKVSGETREMLAVHRPSLDEIIDNMTQVSADLKATAKEVRRNPWRLLHTPDDKELHSTNIYDAARAFSAGAEQLDQAVTKLKAISAANPEGLDGDDPDVQRIREQIQKTFEQFNKAEQALWKELRK
jgi:ABC-type transporter Mla subunit MlaD